MKGIIHHDDGEEDFCLQKGKLESYNYYKINIKFIKLLWSVTGFEDFNARLFTLISKYLKNVSPCRL